MADRARPHAHPAVTAPSRAVDNLSASIDDALALLHEYRSDSRTTVPPKPPALMGLAEQCQAFCNQPDFADEPIRTIHHFACTGGTLITKCIASMPNTQVLSELDPLSSMSINPEKPVFRPTDLIGQTQQGARGATTETRIAMFVASLEVLAQSETRAGRRLVIRDHAHSQFCTTQVPSNRPTLLEILKTRFRTLSIVTVRDPVQSYLATRERKWVHFSPPTFDEYCSRYLQFLKRHEGVPIFRYERFVAHPSSTMREIGEALQLGCQDKFESLFDVFKLTGDSGRTGSTIGHRQPRTPDRDVSVAIATSTNFKKLSRLLGLQSPLD